LQKFRTTLSEELDDLHSELTNLQQSLTRTRFIQRQWTKWFAIYAILAYLVVNISYYTFVLPKDFVNRIYAFMISIAVGVLLYASHWIIRWYFRKTIQIKEEKLGLFKDRRQELIEEVKNKETYAVAKNLSEKYGEKITPEIRSPVVNGKSSISVTSPSNGNYQIQTPVRGGPTRLAAGVTPGKLPRAILPPQRTFWGTMLDTIVGDGPSKRYALICKSCNSHNGMALEEEFEYLSFRCAYCNYFNGARKQKPVFNPDLLNSPQTNMEIPAADPTTECKLTRRSIRVDNKLQHHPDLSSSEESLSDKTK